MRSCARGVEAPYKECVLFILASVNRQSLLSSTIGPRFLDRQSLHNNTPTKELTQADSPDDGEVGASVGGRSVLVDWARFLPLRMSMAALAWADASSPSPSHASTEPFYHRSKL